MLESGHALPPSWMARRRPGPLGLDGGRQRRETDGDPESEGREGDDQVLDGGHGFVPREINLEEKIA